jgi:hypothetical protein
VEKLSFKFCSYLWKSKLYFAWNLIKAERSDILHTCFMCESIAGHFCLLSKNHLSTNCVVIKSNGNKSCQFCCEILTELYFRTKKTLLFRTVHVKGGKERPISCSRRVPFVNTTFRYIENIYYINFVIKNRCLYICMHDMKFPKRIEQNFDNDIHTHIHLQWKKRENNENKGNMTHIRWWFYKPWHFWTWMDMIRKMSNPSYKHCYVNLDNLCGCRRINQSEYVCMLGMARIIMKGNHLSNVILLFKVVFGEEFRDHSFPQHQ